MMMRCRTPARIKRDGCGVRFYFPTNMPVEYNAFPVISCQVISVHLSSLFVWPPATCPSWNANSFAHTLPCTGVDSVSCFGCGYLHRQKIARWRRVIDESQSFQGLHCQRSGTILSSHCFKSSVRVLCEVTRPWRKRANMDFLLGGGQFKIFRQCQLFMSRGSILLKLRMVDMMFGYRELPTQRCRSRWTFCLSRTLWDSGRTILKATWDEYGGQLSRHVECSSPRRVSQERDCRKFVSQERW